MAGVKKPLPVPIMQAYTRYRYAKNWTALALCCISGLIVLVPLGYILAYTAIHGFSALNFGFFTNLPKPVGETGGGIANALVGTVIMLLLSGVIAIPIGILSGIYLAEFGNNAFGNTIRFMTDVMNGLPSIIIGVFAYTLVVIPMKRFSAIAGAVALSILMLPIIIRATEELIKLVPNHIREGGVAIGIPRWKVSIRIILRTALPGIVTAIMLSVARAAGETAPLLFTALGNRFWQPRLDQPMSAVSLQIFEYAKAPYEDWHAQAWAASLVVILMILVFKIIIRIVTKGEIKTAA